MNDSTRLVSGELRALSRRRFLTYTLLATATGAAALAGTFSLLARSPKDAQPRPADIEALTDQEYHLFRAVCAAVLPVDGNAHGLLPWTQVPVLRNIDQLVKQVAQPARGDMTTALKIFDNAAVVSGWHGKRFVDLDVEEARAHLAVWNHGNGIQRALSNLVRKLAYIGYWGEAATWAAIDYDGPVTRRWGLPSLGNAPLPEAG